MNIFRKEPDEELFKSNNVKYTKVVSNKQHVLNSINGTETKEPLNLKDHQSSKNDVLWNNKDKKFNSKLLSR